MTFQDCVAVPFLRVKMLKKMHMLKLNMSVYWYISIYIHICCIIPVKMCMCVCVYDIAQNISGKSKVVKQSSKLSSFMNQIDFELEFVFMSPHCTSGTVSIHTSNELHDFSQFLLLRDHMMIYLQSIALMHHVNSYRVLL